MTKVVVESHRSVVLDWGFKSLMLPKEAIRGPRVGPYPIIPKRRRYQDISDTEADLTCLKIVIEISARVTDQIEIIHSRQKLDLSRPSSILSRDGNFLHPAPLRATTSDHRRNE